MAAADPCSLLIGTMKEQCEQARGTGSGSGSGSSGSGGILGSIIPTLSGDYRLLMMRTGEVIVGLLLVVVAANALIKSNPMVQQASTTVTKVAKKVAK